MFTSRDQENLVHTHQTIAAGKPLNHSVRGLQPKTPGNRVPKTPLRVAFNDENKPLGFKGQKTGLKDVAKGSENVFQTTKKQVKAHENAFDTPIDSRARVPLGAKTTNAKGQAFQTPVLAEQTNKTKRPITTPKSVHSKITVAPSEPLEADIHSLEDDIDVPDIEYAPPPPTELPDPPEVFEYDQSFSQFKGANMCRGLGEIYFAEPRDEYGVALSFREYEKKCRRYDGEIERQIEESLDNLSDPDEELDKHVDAMIAAGPKNKASKVSRIDTVTARGAVHALSHLTVPSVASKTTASPLQKSKKKPAFSVLKTDKSSGPASQSPVRRTTAGAVSKNTIGFPRARPAPSIIPQRPKKATSATETTVRSLPKQSDIHPAQFRELYGDPPEGSDMWVRLRQHELLMEEVGDYDLAGDLFDTNFFPLQDEDRETFQLPMPSDSVSA